jgi:PAS domain S-box-containing protein
MDVGDERREKYATLVEHSSDGIVVVQDGEYVFVNERFCELTGHDREELLGRPFYEVFTPEYRDLVRERYEQRVAGESPPQRYDVALQTADGDARTFDISVSRIHHEGEPATMATFRDVTEHRKLERTYRELFENVGDGLVVHHPETGEMLDVNERFCALTGYDRDELLGETVDKVTPPEYTVENAQERIQRAREEGTHLFEWQAEPKDGEPHAVEVHLGLVDIRGNERVLASVRDISDRRRTERRLRAILDRIDEAIFLARAEELTSPSPAPDFLSSGYEAIWGQPLEQLQDTHENGFFDTLHPEDRDGYSAFIEDILADIEHDEADDRYAREYRIERPNGEQRWVHSDFYPVEWADGTPRIVILSRDVTDRKRRERRMASFEAATDDLATAETPTAATRTAIEAATETLDLPAVGAFLYDDRDGVLRPEAVSAPLADPLDGRTIDPGDGPLWAAFATGGVITPDAETASPTAADGDALAVNDWRAIALGSHGVLLVGAPAADIEAETMQSAHVLAATLEAALNHLEGEAARAAQAEKLQAQTERAERLERVAGLTQRVEAAITDASTRDGIETAVCEKLANVEPYATVWVGAADVGTDRLSPRTVAGPTPQEIAAVDVADEGTDPHPAATAWQTGQVQVVDEIVGNGPTAPWRERALQRGHQSLCAVPLAHAGRTHGVLVIAARRPGVFGDREREAFEQLGTSIGNALTAVERRRALESDDTTEVELQATDADLWVATVAHDLECTVSHERTVRRDDGTVGCYYELSGSPPDDESVRTHIETAKPSTDSVSVTASEERRALVEVTADSWFGELLPDHGAVLRRAVATPDDATLVVELPAGGDVRAFVDQLLEVCPAFEVVAQRRHQQPDRTPPETRARLEQRLTDRQLEVLQTAVAAGYFAWPRDSSAEDVAERLDITQPTLTKHLRAAERKAFDLLLKT